MFIRVSAYFHCVHQFSHTCDEPWLLHVHLNVVLSGCELPVKFYKCTALILLGQTGSKLGQSDQWLIKKILIWFQYLKFKNIHEFITN